MTSSGSSLSKSILLSIVVLLCLPVLGDPKELRKEEAQNRVQGFRLAVYPVENLSGTPAPVREIRTAFMTHLRSSGVEILDDESLEKFMAKHRVRYTGGVDRDTADAFKTEAGVDGVLVASVELYSEVTPPKVAMISRLVSTGPNPVILWMDGVGLAGDDSPGFLSLGLIEDPGKLMDRGLKRILHSLTAYLLTGKEDGNGHRVKKRFQPRLVYRSSSFDLAGKNTVAVVPFFNKSQRKYANDILALHAVMSLRGFQNLAVVEPGVIRQDLLGLRIIMDEGVSFPQVEAISSSLKADLILSGEVFEYQDYQGAFGKPKIDFSVTLIEKASGQVVWGANRYEIVWDSDSYGEGDDGVFFFDHGRVSTAYVMASQMTRAIGEKISGLQRKRATGKVAEPPGRKPKP